MNRDSREHLMKLNPAVAQLLMEHALDTDDVETSFGMIVMRLGYKAVSLRHAGQCMTVTTLLCTDIPEDPPNTEDQ